MPIYGYGTNGAPWIRVTEMSSVKLAKMMKKVKDAEKEFKFDEVFLHSIIYNKDFDEVYIAKYDFSKTGMDIYTYQKQIEKLIFIASKKAGANYKFDIMGTFSIGKIIIMTKNKTAD